jgi:hypothetical protein
VYVRVARFFLVQHTKTGENVPNAEHSKWTYSIPNSRKMDQMNIYVVNQHLPLHDLLNFTQIGIFGLKIYHLATLVYVCTHGRSSLTMIFSSLKNVSAENGICDLRLRPTKGQSNKLSSTCKQCKYREESECKTLAYRRGAVSVKRQLQLGRAFVY